MARSYDSTQKRPPGAADTDDLFAGATLLLVAARGRGGRRSPGRLACLPFLNLGQVAPATQSGPASTPGGPLLWSLLPLASLLPWASSSADSRPTESPPPLSAPVLPGHDRDAASAMPGVLGGLSLRAPEGPHVSPTPGPRWSGTSGPHAPPGAPTAAVAALPTLPAAAPTSPATAAPSRPPAPVGVNPGTVADGTRWSVPLPRALPAARTAPAAPTSTGPTRHRWEPSPPSARPTPAPPSPSPGLAPLPQPTPRLPVEPPAPAPQPAPAGAPPPLPWPGRARATGPGPLADADGLPPLRSAPATITLPQVVQTIQRVVEQTVTEEVARATARTRAAQAPAPAPALEINSEQSVRKLMAAMRQIEQDERLRGGRHG